jgi:hypothetical protein
MMEEKGAYVDSLHGRPDESITGFDIRLDTASNSIKRSGDPIGDLPRQLDNT